MRIDKLTHAVCHGDLARLGHAGQAAGQLGDHAVLVAAQLVQVDLRLAEADAVGGQLACLVDDRGVVQQRLGRDTAHVQADAAQRVVALHQHGGQTQVGGAEGGRIAAGAGAQHQHVVLGIGRAAEAGGGRSRGRRNGGGRLGRFRSLGRRGGGGRGGRRGGGSCRLHFQHHRAFRDLVAYLHADRLHHPALRGRNLHRRLVGLHRDQALLGLDRVAHRHQHFDDFHFLEVADVRNLDLNGIAHEGSPVTARCDGSRPAARPDRR